ncbi:hypothetical protein [Streptomyces collinus]|uniref:hypothetical protein n=1 Tax=Streptomyces collinus TaxID=42684 RepID=UPI00367FBDE4
MFIAQESELVNLAGDHLADVADATEQGSDRINHNAQLPCSFLTHTGLTIHSPHKPKFRQGSRRSDNRLVETVELSACSRQAQHLDRLTGEADQNESNPFSATGASGSVSRGSRCSLVPDPERGLGACESMAIAGTVAHPWHIVIEPAYVPFVNLGRRGRAMDIRHTAVV